MSAETFEAIGQIDVLGGGEWAAADLTLVAKGDQPRNFEFRPEARLRLEDGRTVSLDLSRAQLSETREVTESGRWGELSSGPLGSAAGDYRAGPHVPLELTLRGIANASEVRVRGLVARRSASSDSYRAADVDTVVEVQLLEGPASGAAQEAAAAPAPRFELAQAGWAFALLLLYAAGFAAWLVAILSRDVMAALVGGAWLAYAGTLSWRVASRLFGHRHFATAAPSYRWVPEPRPLTLGEPQKRAHHGVTSYPGMSLVPFFVFVLPMALRPLQARFTGSHEAGFVLGISAALALVLAVILLVEDHRRTADARRFTEALVGASRSSEWTVCEGAFAGELARSVTILSETTGSGKGRSTTLFIAETHVATESVRVGATSIESQGVTWAGGDLTRRDPDPDRQGYHLTPGSSAIAAIAGPPPDGAWRATGPESVLVFTAEGDPAAQLSRSVLAQRLGALPLVLAMGVAIALAIVLA